MIPTFDEWFKAKFYATFDELHMGPAQRYSDAFRALTRYLRDYTTEMVQRAHGSVA